MGPKPSKPSNVFKRTQYGHGDVDAGFKEADVIVANRITDEIRDVMADWWNDYMLPTMKQATTQLAHARPEQSMLRGNFAEAARQFEALFMNELMKSMRATTLDSGLMDGGSGGCGG